MNSADAFDALRARIFADALGVAHSGPGEPAVVDGELFKTQEEADEYNAWQAEHDWESQAQDARRRWEAWQYVALCMDWTIPRDPFEVAHDPVKWCAP